MVITPQQLAAELLAAAARTNVAVARVVNKSASDVKNEARRNATVSSGRSAAKYPQTITYDVANQGVRVSAEIGPEGGGQARLGAILEYGSGGAKNPPHRDLGRALDSQEANFISAMEQIGTVVVQ